MFTDKLKYYDKPCKWLLFLLNIWWPLTILANIWNAVQLARNWNDDDASYFVLYILMAVGLFTCDLLARFLDKTAMTALYVAEGLIILRSVWTTNEMYLAAREASAAMQMEQTGVGAVDAGMAMVGNVGDAVIGFALFGYIGAAIIQITIAVVTIFYIRKRKDLFLTKDPTIIYAKDYKDPFTLMFTGKLGYYNKPCKWMLFLLNFWWPLVILANAWNVLQMALHWDNSEVSNFVLLLLMAVGLFACNLFARFLDKTAMIALYVAEGLVILRSIWTAFNIYIDLNSTSTTMQMEQAGAEAINSGNTIPGFIIFFYAMIILIPIIVAVATIFYIRNRKDLFLLSENQLKERDEK